MSDEPQPAHPTTTAGDEPRPAHPTTTESEKAQPARSTTTVADEPRPAHPTSVAVWGVPSPVAAASPFTATVGVKCSAGCSLAGRPVVVRDDSGRDLGRATLGAEPAAGTHALYAAAVSLTAPSEPGVHAWTAAFPAITEPLSALARQQPNPAAGTSAAPYEAAAASKRETGSEPPHGVASRASSAGLETAATTRPGAPSGPSRTAASGPHHESAAAPEGEPSSTPRHEAASATFSFRSVEPAGNAVTVAVVDRDTEAPLAGADVHLGLYRAPTGADGKARIEAPAGDYDLYVRSPGYTPYTEPVSVTGDAALRVAVVRVSDADLDDDQVWM